MSNHITDRLRLVEMIQFKGLPLIGSISWFDQFVHGINGINQEIFREGIYIGSVSQPGSPSESRNNIESASFKAHKGDIIYYVHLTPQPYDFSGIITTKDIFRRMYDIHLQLQVNNSKQCVESYRADKDPAGSAIELFKKKFERFFSDYMHDQIDQWDESKVDFDKVNQGLSDRFGIIVVSPSWSMHPDPYHEKELEFQQKIELKKRELQAENEIKIFGLQKSTELRKEELISSAGLQELEELYRRNRERLQKEFDRDERVKQNDAMREEKIKSQLYEARIKILSTTVNELTAINSERIRDAFDSNAEVRAILEESLKLLGVFTDPSRKTEEVIDSTLLNDQNTPTADEGEREPTTTDSLNSFSKDELNNNLDQTYRSPSYSPSFTNDSIKGESEQNSQP